MIPQTSKISKTGFREFLVVARAREGWGKGNTFSCGAFCEAKNEIRRRRKSEGGQKFLPSNPLPFCPPERKISKFRVRFVRSCCRAWIRTKILASKGRCPTVGRPGNILRRLRLARLSGRTPGRFYGKPVRLPKMPVKAKFNLL